MPSFLSSLVQSFDFSKSNEEIKEKTTFTRDADVDGWVFLAEEPANPSSGATYADIAAGRKSSADTPKDDHNSKPISCRA